MGEVGILCPDERKFEKEIAHFTKTIKELEGKIVSFYQRGVNLNPSCKCTHKEGTNRTWTR